MNLVVAIQAYRRPDLLWRTLHSLWKAANCTPGLCLTVIAIQDRYPGEVPGILPHDPEVYNLLHPSIGHELCLAVQSFATAELSLGSNRAAHVLAETAFEMEDHVIFMEDDIEVSLDFFCWMTAAFERFEDDPRVKIISSISQRANHLLHDEAKSQQYHTYDWAYAGFQAAGWWRRTWDFLHPHWPGQDKPLDHLSHLLNSKDHRAVGPVVARARHVGCYGGTFNRGLTGEEEFRTYEKNNYVRWNSDMFLRWQGQPLSWTWPSLGETPCQASS